MPFRQEHSEPVPLQRGRCGDRGNGSTKRVNPEWLRFAGVGLVNTAAGYALYLLLLRFLSYPEAYALTYAAGIFVSYGLNSRFVFRRPLELGKALRFPVVYGAQYVLSAIALWTAVELLAVDPRIAALLAVAMTVPVVFLLSRCVIRGEPMRWNGAAREHAVSDPERDAAARR